jgi:D-3-phosphoglycerate dehydrogenase
MRILFADKFPAEQLETMRARGHECELRPKLTGAELTNEISGYDVLVVRSTEVTETMLEAADALRMVIRAGAGYNTIDVQAAGERGVYVCNVPGKNAIAVAELAFGLLLAIDRNIPDNVADLRAGRWDKSRYQKAEGLFERSVGVVGIGAIGLAFAERAHAFGMLVHVLASSRRSVDTERRLKAIGVAYLPDLPSLAAAVDVLSFHVPADPTTRGMVGAELLSHLRPGAIVLNTSRGDLVDEEAMLAALDDGIRAGLDVYPDEPGSGRGEFISALAQHPNVYGTHHIGASTTQAQQAIADEIVEMISAFESGEVRNPVNLDLVRSQEVSPRRTSD